MATGYMVDPTSKLPFLNIMTDVLLMQVPGGKNPHKTQDSVVQGSNQDAEETLHCPDVKTKVNYKISPSGQWEAFGVGCRALLERFPEHKDATQQFN